MATSVGLTYYLQLLALLNASPPPGMPPTEFEPVEAVDAVKVPSSALYVGPEVYARPNRQHPLTQCVVPLILEASVAGSPTQRPSEILDPILNHYVARLGEAAIAGVDSIEVTEIKRVVVQGNTPFIRATITIELRYSHKVGNREVRA